jgi:hypothetical protein
MVVVPVPETGPGAIPEDPEEIVGSTTKTATAAMIRTITIPAMIFTGIFPKRSVTGGDAVGGRMTGSCKAGAEGC